MTGDQLVARARELVEEGNLRRIIAKHDGQTIVESPLMAGSSEPCWRTLTIERQEPPPSSSSG